MALGYCDGGLGGAALEVLGGNQGHHSQHQDDCQEGKPELAPGP